MVLPALVLRSRGTRATVLVVTAALGVQSSALLATGLFDRLGPLSVSGLRFAMAALIVCAFVRPRLRGRSLRAWATIVLFGTSISAMNVFLYLALERLPFGIALTLEFLGPFAVAVVAARRPLAVVFPVLGLAGVVLVVRPSGDLDIAGVLLGLAAAASLAGYVVLAERVSRHERGVDGLALAFVVAAVLTSPFAATALPLVTAPDVALVAVCAILGIVVAFTADFLAVRATSARTVAVMLAFDPVLAAVLGAVFLGEFLDGWTVAGIVLVAVAGGGSAALAGGAVRARRPVVPAQAVAIVEG